MMLPSKSDCISGIKTFYFTFLASLFLHTLASPTLLHYCRHDQMDALLEFKNEFPVNKSNPTPYDVPLSSWNKSSDCCSWEGVMCSVKTGKVISLNLSYVPLRNSLKPNSSLFKLQHLRNLTLKNCSLYGEIPSSLGSLSRLTKLNLLNNNLVGQVPASIGNLAQLRYLDLSQNKLSGNIPISFVNLTNLYLFYIHDNYFESTFPFNMSGFQKLKYFGVGANSFSGVFPTSLLTIPSLIYINLEGNRFTGPIDFRKTSPSSTLKYLNIAYNKFDGPIPDSLSELINLGEIDLSFNRFNGSIPRSLAKLDNLYYLDLSGNKLEGQVPSWLWRLNVVRLSYNSFNSFENNSPEPAAPSETQGIALDLSSNSFQGPFPHEICKITSLYILDLSNNRFSGTIPSCFRNSTGSLMEELLLGNNILTGVHPDVFANATNLKAIDISNNNLEGKLSRSLINCSSLRFLNLQGNGFKDEFPSWLGSLPTLNVLLLRSNHFYGPLTLYHRHNVSIGFQSLRVIDVSLNDLSGALPDSYFSTWREMKKPDAEYDDAYMKDSVIDASVFHSMQIVNKGVDTIFNKIRSDFISIDFSENSFSGSIPESVGLLKGLRLLNMSGNTFTSNVPSSLADLENLEALDLSRNQLSGQIPRELGRLSFLSAINFSHNHLEGPVPRSTQFQSQPCSSFVDNPKLSGLEDICGENRVPITTPQESKELLKAEEKGVNWIAAAIAYGPGFFCGMVIGHIFATHYKYEWFMVKFSRNKPRSFIRSTR